MHISGLVVAAIFMTASIAVSVVPGCVSQVPAGNGTGITGVQTTTSSEPGIPEQPPFIIINTVGDHRTGDEFGINGTTNLVAGEIISYSVILTGRDEPGPSPTGCPLGCPPAIYHMNESENVSYGTIVIESNGRGPRTWSFRLNTSGSGYGYSLDYIVNMSARNGSVRNSTFFSVS